MLSECARLQLTYEGPTDPELHPGVAVLKICKSLESNRESAIELDAYKLELDFYESLASKVPLRVPKCHGLYRHRDRPNELFGILLEDLKLNYEPLVQLVGITKEETLAMAEAIGKFHAAFWEHPMLSSPEMQPSFKSGQYANPTGEYRARLHLWLNDFPGCWAEYSTLLDDAGIGVGTIDTCDTAKLLRICELMQRPVISDKMLRRWWRILDSRPRTLVHGDMRADNLFKNKDGQFAIIDWQLYQSGAGGTEFEQTVGVNGAPQETHAAMQEVFEVYHRTLVEHGPAGIGETYTLQMIRDDYHIACWYLSLIHI